MPLKRISLDSAIFPPKKRALLEHKAEVLLDVSNFNHQNGVHHFDDKHKSTNQEHHLQFSRYRSDSGHLAVSLANENFDKYEPDVHNEKLSYFENVYDHRTPERNPIKLLNSQIAKPLFQAQESGRALKERYEDNKLEEKENHIRIDENESGRSFSQQRQLYKDHKMVNISQAYKPEKFPPFCDSGRISLSKTSPKSENHIGNSDQNRKRYHNNGIHTTNENIPPGPMVSLIGRFNAEAKNVKKVDQSNSEKSQNQSNGLVHDFQVNSSLKNMEMLGNKSIHKSHVTDNQSAEFTELQHLKATLTAEKGDGTLDDKNDVYTCTICSKQIKQKGHFLVHLKSHENQNCKCRICGEEMQSLEKLKEHMRCSHKGDKPFKCDHCQREFSQYNNLRRHLRVHRAKIYKCELCDREFNEEFYLTMHMGTHTGKRVYSCGVCNSTFTSSHDLKMHVKTHSPSQLHTCDVCGKSFSKACVLRQHKKGHTGDRPHKCEKCAKTFIHRHHLTMHMRSHSDDKQYTCDICKKEFFQSSHLYKHLRCHGDEKEVVAVNAMKENLYKKTFNMTEAEDQPAHSSKQEQAQWNRTLFNEDRKINLEKKSSMHNSQSNSVQRSKIASNQVSTSVALSYQTRQHMLAPDLTPDPQKVGHSRHMSGPQNPQHQPYPPAMLPQSLTGPAQQQQQHLSQNLDPVYLAYASQYRAYYNSLYMMNLMSHDALLHPGNSAKQNGRGHMTLNDNQIENSPSFSSRHSFESSNNLKSNDNVIPKNFEKSVTKEEKRRTETAEELVKMSNGKKKDLQFLSPNGDHTQSPNNAKQTDITQSSPFTKCISDIVNKTDSLHKRQTSHHQHQENKPVYSQLDVSNKAVTAYDIHRHLQPYYTQPAKADMTVVNSMKNQRTSPIDCTTRSSSLTKATSHNGALNLSLNRDNSVKGVGFGSAVPEVISNKTGGLSNQVVMTTKLWNPAHSLSDVNHPTATSSQFPSTHKYLTSSSSSYYQPISSLHSNYPNTNHLNSNHFHSYHFNINHLHNNNAQGNLSISSINSLIPIPRNMNDSPKKRHASSHDVSDAGLAGVGLDLRDSWKVGRHRHWSEIQPHQHAMDTVSRRMSENKDVIKNDEIGQTKEKATQGHSQSRGEYNKVLSAYEIHRHLEPCCTPPSKCTDDKASDPVEDPAELHRINIYDVDKECKNSGSFEKRTLEEIDIRTNENQEVCENIPKNPEINENVPKNPKLCENVPKNPEICENVPKNSGKTLCENISKNLEICENIPKNLEIYENVPKNSEIYEYAPKNLEICEDISKSVVLCKDDQIADFVNMSVKYLMNAEGYENDSNEIEQDENDPNILSGLAKDENTVDKNMIECIFCGEFFKNKEKLKKHVVIHAVDKPYVCKICQKSFSHRHNLNRHKMSHNSKSFECSVCKRAFKEQFYLQMHMKVHQEETNHQCEICGSHVEKADMLTHTRKHLGTIVDNPTYKQIGHRVREILNARS